jgi:hypothetical protein
MAASMAAGELTTRRAGSAAGVLVRRVFLPILETNRIMVLSNIGYKIKKNKKCFVRHRIVIGGKK